MGRRGDGLTAGKESVASANTKGANEDMDLLGLSELRSRGADGGRGLYGRRGASSIIVGVNETLLGEFIEPREAREPSIEAREPLRLRGDGINAARASKLPADRFLRMGFFGLPSSFKVENEAKEEKESPLPFGVGVPAPSTSRAVSGK